MPVSISPDSYRAGLWLYFCKDVVTVATMSAMIHRVGRTLRSLWGSMAFSLTLTYGLLAVVTTLVLLAFVYLQTVGVLHRQIYSQNTTRALYLANEFEQGGQQAVIDAINHALDDHMEVVQQIFLYLDADGNKLAGNLDESPDLPGPTFRSSEVLTSPDGTEIHGRVQSIVLPDVGGYVGRGLDDMYAIRELIGRASLAAVLVALVLVGCGTYVSGRSRPCASVPFDALRRKSAPGSSANVSRPVPVMTSLLC